MDLNSTSHNLYTALYLFRQDPNNESLRTDFLNRLCAFVTESGPSVHFFHNHPDAAVEAMLVLSLTESSPAVNQFQHILSKQLSHCLECINVYYLARTSFFKIYSSVYLKQNLDKFLHWLENWDLTRHASTLSKFLEALALCKSDPVAEKNLRKDTLIIIYEILNHPASLRVDSIDHSFTSLLLSVQQKSKLKLRDLVFPGVVLLSVHRIPAVREWAQGCILQAAIPIKMSALPNLANVLLSIIHKIRLLYHSQENHLNLNDGWNISTSEHALWKGFALFCAMIEKSDVKQFFDQLMPDADRLICSALSKDNAEEFWIKFEFFQIVINSASTQWLSSSKCPTSFRTIILTHILKSRDVVDLFCKPWNTIDAPLKSHNNSRIKLLCDTILKFILLTPSLESTTDSFELYDWLLPCMEDLRLIYLHCTLHAKQTMDLFLVKLLEIKNLRLSISINPLIHLIGQKNAFINTTLFGLVEAAVQQDVQQILHNEQNTTPHTCFTLGSLGWTNLQSYPFEPATLSALVRSVLPLTFSSAIDRGASIYNLSPNSTGDIEALGNVVLSIRCWLRQATLLGHSVSFDLNTRLCLVLFNDIESQTISRDIFIHSGSQESFSEVLSFQIMENPTQFLNELFNCLIYFKKNCHQPTNCLHSANAVVELLDTIVVQTLKKHCSSLIDSRSDDQSMWTTQHSLNLWLHCYLTTFSILNACLRWAKYACFSSQEIKKLVYNTLVFMRTLFQYHKNILPADIKQNLLSDWCQECTQVLLPWTKTTDSELKTIALSFVLEILSLSTTICAIFEFKLFEKINSLSTLCSMMNDSQSMDFAMWISQQEHHHGISFQSQKSVLNTKSNGTAISDEAKSQKVVPNDQPTTTDNSLALSSANEVESTTSTSKSKAVVHKSKIALISQDLTHLSNSDSRSDSSEDDFSDSDLEFLDNPNENLPRTSDEHTFTKPLFSNYTQSKPLNGCVSTPGNTSSTNTLILQRRGFALPRNVLSGSKSRSSATSGKLSKLQQLRAEAAVHCRRSNIMKPITPVRSTSASVTTTTFEVKPSARITAIENGELRERRQVKTIDLPLSMNSSSRMGRLIQTAATMKSTPVKPLRSIKDLYKIVLSWDISMDASQLPSNIKSKKMVVVPNMFQLPIDYINCFEPLLFLECWQQFVQARDELHNSDSIVILIHSVQMVDDMHDITLLAQPSDMKLQQLSENTILLLTMPESNITLLACIRSMSYKDNDVYVVCQTFLGNRMQIIPHLKPKSKWDATLVFSLTTFMREYRTLIAINSIPLSKEILQPAQTKQLAPNKARVDEYQQNLKVNFPQANAIAAAIECKSGFVLIQGPPGTGKTKTILGLIGALQCTATVISLPGKSNERLNSHQQNLAATSSASSHIPASKKRLLCCAPSNAAIDEIARRLIDGILNLKGQIYKPKIVRVGTTAIHADIKSVTLDYLVEERLKTDIDYQKADSKIHDAGTNRSDIFKEMAQLKSERDNLRAFEDQPIEISGKTPTPSTTKLREIGARMAALAKLLDNEAMSKNDGGVELERAKRNIRAKILAEADVVLATLSGAGHNQFSEAKQCTFHTVIVDEACQAVELSCLIPLCYGAQKCIMVGDPNQLPPTILSQVAQDYSYDQSLFQRLMKSCKDSIHLLSIQYRMHPHISLFPSLNFYNSALKDAPGLNTICSAPWHSHRLFPPYLLLNAVSGQEQFGSRKSLFNHEEASLCVGLVKTICTNFPDIKFFARIGIITFYKLQARKLRDMFVKHFGHAILNSVDINTVDGFQGQEKDIILLSCVRASKDTDRSVGFISDTRRMNVALTRAKHSLIIIGNSHSLKTDPVWKNLVNNAKQRSLTLKISSKDIQVGSNATFSNLIDDIPSKSSSSGMTNNRKNETQQLSNNNQPGKHGNEPKKRNYSNSYDYQQGSNKKFSNQSHYSHDKLYSKKKRM
ncbi:hypothetical protein BATDEDRAFT_24512 [Batrachochytrium dendrobatidis JAM81]|uniref:AAA+ ATPase domain-containing protein n=1 Tax=Batrachochytrium dendrobatidis (strain JAM81 / FGSC 10211) TaxID=684364 RepID=F4P174_BATDJ|nr:uncharacterized protein BATDEDRAFT_24512 [Batrachochytrium dendrobatidis JAM81]EGF80951.1 hypothetical protein BATDEDRAFT_24512 [Batrachochytrium dendrobatidis JAM81]|eukprot:XP_006678473.1 hypothetical protein BATDEDRAFT_24512 [Batrachochytrium dendrobatidis JAM81]